jgi:type II secretory pathway pseudopilin PulG
MYSPGTRALEEQRMQSQKPTGHGSRRGITVVELLFVLATLSLLTAIAGPRISRLIASAGASRAIGVVASDLEYALSLATRVRKPVRLSCECPAGTYSISDRATGTVLFRRRLGGPDGGFGVTGLSFSAENLDLFPGGITSGGLTITVVSAHATRQASISSAGFVRVIR